MSMKNSNDIIGNRTPDLPACSAVSQPTAPPAACHEDTGGSGGLLHSFLTSALDAPASLSPVPNAHPWKTRIIGTPLWQPHTLCFPTVILHTFYILHIYNLPIHSQALYTNPITNTLQQSTHNLNTHRNTVSRSTLSAAHHSLHKPHNKHTPTVPT